MVSQGIGIMASNKCTVLKTEVKSAAGTTWGKEFNDHHGVIHKHYVHNYILTKKNCTKLCAEYINADRG